MSGVYIRGMKMPTSCYECTFYRKTDPVYDYCCISTAVPKGYVPENCPLILVPDHGDLIDRDALAEDGWTLHKEVMRMGGYAIHEMPLKNPNILVIIPADKEKDG